jgi:hypothetical protein
MRVSESRKSPLEIAEDLAKSSGNNFHSKVVKFFRDSDWAVLVSPYYVDPSTDKAREIDLIAERLFLTEDRFGRTNGYIRFRLHIECKYINQTTVFWFDKQDGKRARKAIEAKTLFKSDNTFMNHHHYLGHEQKVAKLFSSEKNKDTESEPMFRAINQTLNGLIHNDQVDLRRVEGLTCHKTIEYPVIICSTFETFFGKELGSDDAGGLTQITENFFLEIDYAYRLSEPGRTMNDYFLIDVVEFKQLSKFLHALDMEFVALRNMI